MSLVIHWKTQKLILLSKINLNYALFYVFKNYFHKNVFANVTYLFVQFITFTVKVSHNSRIFLLNFSSDMKGKVVEGRGGGSGNGRFTSLILWAGLPIFTYILTSRHNFANSLDNKNKWLRTLVVELSEYTRFFTKKINSDFRHTWKHQGVLNHTRSYEQRHLRKFENTHEKRVQARIEIETSNQSCSIENNRWSHQWLILITYLTVAVTDRTRGQSNLTKSASRGAHSPVTGHPRGSKFVQLNSWVGFPISVP